MEASHMEPSSESLRQRAAVARGVTQCGASSVLNFRYERLGYSQSNSKQVAILYNTQALEKKSHLVF